MNHERPRVLRVQDVEDRIGRELNGLMSIYALQEIAGGEISSHYTGPRHFERAVDWADHFKSLKNNVVPTERRWVTAADLPANVQVLSLTDPSIKRFGDDLTRLNRLINDSKGGEREIYRKEYTKVFKQMLELLKSHLKIKESSRVFTLLKGGLITEEVFDNIDQAQRSRIDLKRLRFGDGYLMVGANHPHNFPRIANGSAESAPYEPVDVIITEDCIATWASIGTLLMLLKDRVKRGEMPPIGKVHVLAAIGAQPGIEALIKDTTEMGFDVNVVVTDAVYGLNENYYLIRTGEQHSNGDHHENGMQAIGDAGQNLVYAGVPGKGVKRRIG